MSFVNIPERTTSDANSFADINQLQENIRVLGGNGNDAPTNDIETLSGTVASFITDNKASSAQAIAGTDDTKIITPLKMREGLNASGSAPVYACRAWISFNGTGTPAVIGSGNFSSSITDNGTGNYTITFTTAMPDANYCVTGTASASGGGSGDQSNVNISARDTTYIQIVISDATNNTAVDRAYIEIAVFR